METFYRENILNHCREPRHHGRLDRPTISREESNPLCGDVIHMDLLIEDGRLVDARFDGRGCAVSQAAASMLLEEVVGQDIEAVKAFGRDDLFALIGAPLTPARMKCALLSLGVLRDAVYGAVGRGP